MISQAVSNGKAQLFVESAQALLNFVQGGIVAHNSGNLKEGVPFIIAGLNSLAAIMSRTGDPQRTYQDVINFLLSRSDEELSQILALARSRVHAKQ